VLCSCVAQGGRRCAWAWVLAIVVLAACGVLLLALFGEFSDGHDRIHLLDVRTENGPSTMDKSQTFASHVYM
jgi:hypothetical protein